MERRAARPSRALVMAGVCHRTASVAEREALARALGDGHAALDALRAGGLAREVMALVTCNRVEVYAAGDDRRALEARLRMVLGDAPVSVRHDGAAALHLVRVAAGLESRVPGDHGIRRQLRDAAARARAAGASGIVLNRLVDAALGAGRRARGAAAAASIADCALDAAERRLGGLEGSGALVIGEGALGRSVARMLVAEGARVRVAGRAATGDRAVLADLLAASDLVVSATSSPVPVVGADQLSAAARPLLVLDLAVPRDIDPAAGVLPGVTLLDVDAVADAAPRPADAGVRRIATAAARDWEHWWARAAAGPDIATMRAREQRRLAALLATLPASERAAARREGARRLHLMTGDLLVGAAGT